MTNEPGPASSVRRTTVGMRRMLAVAAGLVLIIGLPTYLFPTETATLFSWTVEPPITAAFLGGAYLTSVFVEYLASRERIWANARIAVPAVLLFTGLTTIVTLRHLDKFHFGSEHSAFTQLITWVWLVVYLVVPPLLAVLWYRQTQAPGQDPPRRFPVPVGLRVLLGIQAVVLFAVGVALYVAPVRTAAEIWPWPLTPLTGGAVGAWLVAIGVGVAHGLWEADLRRIRAWMVAYVLFGVLQLLAVVRLAGDDIAEVAATPLDRSPGVSVIDWSDGRIWGYLVVLVSIVVAAAWALAASPGRDQ